MHGTMYIQCMVACYVLMCEFILAHIYLNYIHEHDVIGNVSIFRIGRNMISEVI